MFLVDLYKESMKEDECHIGYFIFSFDIILIRSTKSFVKYCLLLYFHLILTLFIGGKKNRVLGIQMSE